MFERPKIVEKMSEKTWRATENEKERRIILKIFCTVFMNVSILRNVTSACYQVKQKGNCLCMELENYKSIYKNYRETPRIFDSQVSTARNVCKAARPKRQTKVYSTLIYPFSYFIPYYH